MTRQALIRNLAGRGEHLRANRITVMAAARVGDPGSPEYTWLVRDEEGTWHSKTLGYLESTARRAAELKLTPAQVDKSIASKLALEALTAMMSRPSMPPGTTGG